MIVPRPKSPTLNKAAANESSAQELNIAEVLRFIAQCKLPDGIDYTRDRNKWLLKEPDAVERLLNDFSPYYDRLVAESRKKRRGGSREAANTRKHSSARCRLRGMFSRCSSLWTAVGV